MAKKKPLSETLFLRDSNGRIRIALFADDDAPRMVIYDVNMCERVVIGMEQEKPLACLLAEDGKSLAGVGVDAENTTGFSLFDGSGAPVVTVSVKANGERSIDILNPRAQTSPDKRSSRKKP